VGSLAAAAKATVESSSPICVLPTRKARSSVPAVAAIVAARALARCFDIDDLELLPRILRDVSRVETATTVLGTRMPVPIILSPVGAPRLFHHEGELAVARAARHSGLTYGVSTLATQPIEAIADAAAGSPLWFQLYLWRDRSVARDLMARAWAAGYRALLVSADSTVRSERGRELHRGIELPTPELNLRTVLDGARHPAWSSSPTMAVGRWITSRRRSKCCPVSSTPSATVSRSSSTLPSGGARRHRDCAGPRRPRRADRPRPLLRPGGGRRGRRAPCHRHPHRGAAHVHGPVRSGQAG
jgi:FMN-dependent dehydrogenase